MTQGNPVFAASVAIGDDHQRMITQAGAALTTVNDYVIDCQDTADVVVADMQRYQKQAKALDEVRKGIVKPLDDARTNAQAFFVPAIEKLNGAVAHCKRLLLGWTQEQELLRQAEQRRLDEIARKEKAEREAKAAAERARAEEEAAALRRRAEEEEAKRVAALAEGNTRAAAAAAAAAARAAEQAATKVEAAEQKIADVAAIAPVAMAVVPSTKTSGFSTRKNWKARLRMGVTEQQAVTQIAAVLAQRPELVVLLKLDMTAAKKMASTFEKSFNVPGLESFDDPIAASRAA